MWRRYLLILALVQPGVICLAPPACAGPAAAHGDGKVLARLQRRAAVNLRNVPFTKAIHELLAPAGVDVYISHSALSAAGVVPTAPVTLRLPHPVAISTALRLLLKRAHPNGQLNYAVYRGMVIVSSSDACKGMAVTRVYSLAAVLGRQQAASRRRVRHLAKVIENTIDRNTWVDNGGTVGSIRANGGALVIVTCERDQARIARLLVNLQAVRLQQKRRRADPRRRP